MFIKTNRYLLPPLSAVDFSITYAVETDIPKHSPLHIHQECEIYINLSGDVSFEVEGHIYPVTRGSVIITRPYEYHHCIYHSSQTHEHYWITFSAVGNEEFLDMFFERKKGIGNLILLNETECDNMCRVLEELANGKTNSLKQQIDFLQLLYGLSQGKRDSLDDKTSALPPHIKDVLSYMDDHLTEAISIAELAKVAHTSVNTLERHFKKLFDLTPLMMLKKRRLIASLPHLRAGCSISHTAALCGFSDYSHYIQLFRKQFGMTPLQYKKKVLEK